MVGDLEPGRLARYEYVSQGSDARIVVERSQRNAVFGNRCRPVRRRFRPRIKFVDDWRPADGAKPAEGAGGRLIEADQIFTLNPLQVRLADSRAASKRCALLFAAHRAVAIARRAADLELYAAAQAACAQG